jgi:hypothetical protein
LVDIVLLINTNAFPAIFEGCTISRKELLVWGIAMKALKLALLIPVKKGDVL